VSEPNEPATPPDLDRATTAKSLRYLLNSAALGRASDTSAPLLHLKQRLEQADGAAWLEACFARPPFAPLDDAGARLRDGSFSLAELRALKERAKAGFAPGQPHDARLAAIAAYFLAIAAALSHHELRITSQPLAELRTLLIDLAASVAEPWSSFLSEAAFVEPAG
jgi:hypothetical protein